MDPFNVRVLLYLVLFFSDTIYSSTGGIYAAAVPIVMRETRSAVMLTRVARRLREETGDRRYRSRAEDVRGSLRELMWTSCTRPFCGCLIPDVQYIVLTTSQISYSRNRLLLSLP
jgi:hypothetical protein